jgi:SSS family solute:Na+ symporter
MTTSLSTADMVIIAVYFAGVLSIGLHFRRRTSSSTDYFLGLAGAGSKSGLAVGHFEWLAILILLLLGWVFTPFYLRSGVFTVPEFLERGYGSASRYYLSLVSIVAYVLTKISIALYAGGILLNAVVGWDMYTSAVVIVLATGAYTVLGGLAAVIYTDLIQMFILIIGSVALTLLFLWWTFR